MSLPYDIARCLGMTVPLCDTCQRSTEPGHPTRKVMIAPAWKQGRCENYIGPTTNKEQHRE